MNQAKKKSVFRRSFSFFFRIAVFLTLLCLFISIMARYIPPGVSIIPAYFGLIFPYLFLLGLFSYIIAVVKKYRFLIVAGLIPVFWSFFIMAGFYQWGLFNDDKPEQTPAIKFMTFNVRLFNWYSWKKNAELRDSIMDFIRTENPDVICMQEYFENTKGEFETFNTLVDDLGYTYHHRYFPVIVLGFQRFGIATFSKFPIVGKKQIQFDGSSNMVLQSDVQVDSLSVIRVLNCHLESIRLSGEDINYVSQVDDLGDKEIERGKGILSRLRRAFRERQSQADLVADAVAESTFPVIVCGDFNDVPVSYAYRRISKGLNDAFIESGRGAGNTYPSKLHSFRIDYILYSPSLQSYETKIHKNEFSDHYALSTYFTY